MNIVSFEDNGSDYTDYCLLRCDVVAVIIQITAF